MLKIIQTLEGNEYETRITEGIFHYEGYGGTQEEADTNALECFLKERNDI